MLAHIGFTVSDIERTKEMYTKALAPLDIRPEMVGEGYVGFGRDGDLCLWLGAPSEKHTTVASDVHVCFLAPSRSAVEKFHTAGLAAGFRDNGAPGVREHYSPLYYAAFLLDADGNNIEAVCFAE